MREPEFYDYFRAVTPIDVIERMQIGSRPVHRSERGCVDSLRAVPWVFAWTQTRHMLPGWYGAGAGLAAARKTLWFRPGARRVYGVVLPAQSRSMTWKRCWAAPIWISPTSTTCSRSEPLRRFFAPIREEYARTRHQVLTLKGCAELLDSDGTLQRAIQLRNPYVDPMNLMQVDLLRRWRATDRAGSRSVRSAAREHQRYRAGPAKHRVSLMTEKNTAVAIRPAREDEVHLVLQFVRELAEYERLSHEVVATEAEAARDACSARALRRGSVCVRLNDEPGGFALFFHNYSTFLGAAGNLPRKICSCAPPCAARAWDKRLLEVAGR